MNRPPKLLEYQYAVYSSFLAAILLFTTASCTQEVPPRDVREDFLDRGIDSVQTQLIFENAKVFPNKTQLSIALITDTATTFVGLMKRNDTLISIENRNANFETGAVSMVFTSTLLADFVQRGKVGLTDSIGNYIPVSLKDSSKITFEQLANHTSGLPRVPTKMLLKSLFKMDNPYKDFGNAQMAAYLKGNSELASPPGETYSFSNLGMGVLGYSLSKIDSTPFPELLQNRIFKPYGMIGTSAIRADVKDSLVSGLNEDGKRTPNWDMAAMAGAGAVISTANDMAGFAKAQFNPNDNVLALTRKKTFTIDDKESIGLGWIILQKDEDTSWLTQSGGTGGYSASVAINTLNHTAVVVLSNVSASNDNKGNIQSLCFGLLETLGGETTAGASGSDE